MAQAIGINEALILTALSWRPGTITAITDTIAMAEPVRPVSRTAVYIALQRMAKRRFVNATTESVVSADRRSRTVGLYSIGAEGTSASAMEFFKNSRRPVFDMESSRALLDRQMDAVS